MSGKLIVPDGYRETVLQDICRLVSEGWSLKRVCKLPGFPRYGMVQSWLRRDRSFQAELADAVRVLVMSGITECIEIADSCFPSSQEIAAARLRIDTRMKMLKLVKESAIVDERDRLEQEKQELWTVLEHIKERGSNLPPGAVEVDGRYEAVER